MTKDQQIETLKKALREAIKDNQRVRRFMSPDDDGDCSLVWTDDTKRWAKLANLDLSKLHPDHYTHPY